jgi:hypothetical protein
MSLCDTRTKAKLNTGPNSEDPPPSAFADIIGCRHLNLPMACRVTESQLKPVMEVE